MAIARGHLIRFFHVQVDANQTMRRGLQRKAQERLQSCAHLRGMITIRDTQYVCCTELDISNTKSLSQNEEGWLVAKELAWESKVMESGK